VSRQKIDATSLSGASHLGKNSITQDTVYSW
jgi:hypothetical protein